MSIAIVTDSTSDIPADLASEYRIQVVPAILIMDGESIEDGKGLTRREFYERMPSLETLPTTATPSAGTFQKIYENLFGQGFQEILSIHVSGLLSGIFSTAQIAAQAFGDRVKVIDSGQVSMGLGFQVLEAAEAAAKGLALSNVIQQVENVRQRVRLVAMLDTLEYIRRSGRVSWARARIGSLLRIKPFVEVRDGLVLSAGQTRTYQKGVRYLVELLSKIGAVERLAVLHTNAEAEARKMLDSLNVSLQQAPLVVNVTTIVGTHVGPNGLGFAAVVEAPSW